MTTVTITTINEKSQTDPAGSYLGMTIAIASWSMMFATLFICYFVLRGRQIMWPPMGLRRLPLFLPIVNTCVLFTSSYLLRIGIMKFTTGTGTTCKRYLLMAITTGFLFLVLQILLWGQVSDSGIHLNTGAFGAVFYMMTWFHALHIVGGLTALIYITSRIARGLTPEEGLLRARLIAIFWHFLVIVWVAIFLLIFVI